MAVGIYYGDSKVSNLENFLHVFIVEMDGLLANEISFDGVHFQIILHSFVCDAPARALLKNIKGHSGYFGCEKCQDEGEYFEQNDIPKK